MKSRELVTLAPPPADPRFPPCWDDWARAESDLGITFPDDFKWLMSTYGRGRFYGVALLSPACPPEPPLFYQWIQMELVSYAALQRDHPSFHCDLPPYPAEGGILPWATDWGGGMACWVMSGHPNEWPTVYLDDDWSDRYERFEMGCVDFLVAWLNRSILPKSLSDPAHADGPLFEPREPLTQR